MKTEKRASSLKYPFAASKSMSEMMEFVRKPGWKPKVNQDLIKKLRIATNNEGKVVGALRFLGFIDDAGNPTKDFEELKKNYVPTLKRVTQEKYADLLSIIPPDMITLERLKTYFGNPAQGAERRTRFFVWLCTEASIELPRISALKG